MRLTRGQFLWLASVFELGLVVLAYALGGLLDIDPVAALRVVATGLFWGALGTLPLYGLFLLSDLGSTRSLGPISAVGIVAALLGALTFLPAILLLTVRALGAFRAPEC